MDTIQGKRSTKRVAFPPAKRRQGAQMKKRAGDRRAPFAWLLNRSAHASHYGKH